MLTHGPGHGKGPRKSQRAKPKRRKRPVANQDAQDVGLDDAGLERTLTHTHARIWSRFFENALRRHVVGHDLRGRAVVTLWDQFRDPATSLPFYFNAARDETLWVLPDGTEVRVAEMVVARTCSPTEQLDEHCWLQFWDADFNAPYYFCNDGSEHVRWTASADMRIYIKRPQQHEHRDETHTSARAWSEPAADHDIWVQYWSDEDRCPYFASAATGELSWTVPSGAVIEQCVDTAHGAAANLPAGGGGAPPSSSLQLSLDLERVSCTTYWLPPLTSDSTPQLSESVPSDSTSIAEPPAPPPAHDAASWDEIFDECWAETYWYNSQTGQSSWIDPHQLAKLDQVGSEYESAVADDREIYNCSPRHERAASDTPITADKWSYSLPNSEFDGGVSEAVEGGRGEVALLQGHAGDALASAVGEDRAEPWQGLFDESHPDRPWWHGAAPGEGASTDVSSPSEKAAQAVEWEELVDEASGWPYWYSSVTGVSTYTSPFAQHREEGSLHMSQPICGAVTFVEALKVPAVLVLTPRSAEAAAAPAPAGLDSCCQLPALGSPAKTKQTTKSKAKKQKQQKKAAKAKAKRAPSVNHAQPKQNNGTKIAWSSRNEQARGDI
jgi:hypothetical protein